MDGYLKSISWTRKYPNRNALHHLRKYPTTVVTKRCQNNNGHPPNGGTPRCKTNYNDDDGDNHARRTYGQMTKIILSGLATTSMIYHVIECNGKSNHIRSNPQVSIWYFVLLICYIQICI